MLCLGIRDDEDQPHGMTEDDDNENPVRVNDLWFRKISTYKTDRDNYER